MLEKIKAEIAEQRRASVSEQQPLTEAEDEKEEGEVRRGLRVWGEGIVVSRE